MYFNCDGISPSRPLYFLGVLAHPETKEIQLDTGGFKLHLFLKTGTGLNHLADAIKTQKAMAIFSPTGFFNSNVASDSFLQDSRVGHPRPGGKSILCLVYCRSSCCLVSLTMAPVDILFASSCSRSPRTTAYTFFSANLFINKNDGPFGRFSLLRSSPMV
jgi:hypothetical protein